uniref:Secreted protein n=1 Tax=Bursaphelenchus xylophilus TaxID=6326 RepID=A0A1I7S413_BURXY
MVLDLVSFVNSFVKILIFTALRVIGFFISGGRFRLEMGKITELADSQVQSRVPGLSSRCSPGHLSYLKSWEQLRRESDNDDHPFSHFEY